VSKGRPYPDEVQAEVMAACRENREVSSAVGLPMHSKRNLLHVIRDFCLDCMGGSPPEVRKCTSVGCDLWPYRLRKNPFRAPPPKGAGRPENFK